MAKKLFAALSDTTLFLQEWWANPQRTGAVAPSSPRLAAAMARWLPTNRKVMCSNSAPAQAPSRRPSSNAVCARIVSLAIEKNPRLAQLLRNRFPSAHIITGDAWHLDDLLRERPEPIESVGAAPQMLVRFRQDVIDLKPKVVVILAGINDIAGNTGPERWNRLKTIWPRWPSWPPPTTFT